MARGSDINDEERDGFTSEISGIRGMKDSIPGWRYT